MEKEDEENNNNDRIDDVYIVNELHPNGGATPNLELGIGEIVEDCSSRISEFPAVVKHAVIWPHASLTAIMAAERVGLIWESKRLNLLIALENISFGQLKALSTVPADSLSLDVERSDRTSSTYVISPPPIME